jgi:hypothetical protein
MTAAYDHLLLIFRALARAREYFDKTELRLAGKSFTGSIWPSLDSWRYDPPGNRESGISWTLNLHWVREGTEAWWDFEITLDHAAAQCRVHGSSGFQSRGGELPLRTLDPIEVVDLRELNAAVDSVLNALFSDLDRDFRVAKEAEAAEDLEWNERRASGGEGTESPA